MARRHMARYGAAGGASSGLVRHVPVWRGRLGEVVHGGVWQGMAGEARCGEVWRGVAGQGMEKQQHKKEK